MFRFRINPDARELPHCSALLNGVARRHRVRRYRTTLSIKSVVRLFRKRFGLSPRRFRGRQTLPSTSQD